MHFPGNFGSWRLNIHNVGMIKTVFTNLFGRKWLINENDLISVNGRSFFFFVLAETFSKVYAFETFLE